MNLKKMFKNGYVRILGKKYTIVQVDRCVISGKMGEVNYVNQKIRIDKDMIEEVKEETLLHEICHVVLMAIDCKHEEQFNDSLSQILFSVMKDNEVLILKDDDKKLNMKTGIVE